MILYPATADVIHQAQFALDVKAAVLPLYEKIFDVKYPLPKLDTLVVSNPLILSSGDTHITCRPVTLMQVLWRIGA